MANKYMVDLEAEEQEILSSLLASGTERVRKVNQSRILLKAAEGWNDEQMKPLWM